MKNRSIMDFDLWILLVKRILIKNNFIGKNVVLCRKSWKDLFDDGLSPIKAVSVNMECESSFTLKA